MPPIQMAFMEKRGPLVIHCTANEGYFVIAKPKEWVVAISDESVMGYDAPMPLAIFDKEEASCRSLLSKGCAPLMVERWKATNATIYDEMKAIKALAQRYEVPDSMVRLLVHPRPRALVEEMVGDTVTADQGELIDHKRCRVMTSVMLYDVWGTQDLQGYRKWFQNMYASD